MSSSRTAILLALAALMALALAVPATAAPTRTYEVTVTNHTSGQPFTPPAIAAHKGNQSFFAVGEPASSGIQAIAENGNLAPLLEVVADGVGTDFFGVVDPGTLGGPVLPGETATFTIEAAPPFNFVSWASMLICTNDGFTGVSHLKLPSRLGQSVTVDTAGYDAGTEINTEDFADIVPPCQGLVGVSSGDAGTGATNPALAEDGVIAHHPGIMGGDDLLPSVHGWDVDAPVASITITRTG